MRLRRAVERRIRGEEFVPNGWEGALWTASRLFALGISLREYGLKKDMPPVLRLPRPVISVGNLTVGGTGKTPLVITIARSLQQTGLQVAVLSRGYGRKRGRSVQIVSLGGEPLCDIDRAGDESFLLANRLKGVQVWVGRSRYRSGMNAMKKRPPDVYVLDDGFQHRRLHRDLDIVIARSSCPFGNGKLLPAGSLREPVSALGRADLLVVNGGSNLSSARKTEREIKRIFPALPVVFSRYRPLGLIKCSDDRHLSSRALTGKKVSLVCGVGSPERFSALVSGLGARVVRTLFFPDHYWYTPSDMAFIRQCLQEVEAVVTTEKDLWKLRRAGASVEQILALQVELEVQPNESLLYHLQLGLGRTVHRLPS